MNNNNLQKLIDEVIEKADIVKIIDQYVHLEKKGSDYIGLCPFHDDKNPSMHVSPTKKIFKCFSCNTAGNVIGFVQKYKNISFMEALRELAKEVGIEVALSQKEIEEQKNKKFYDITNDAKDYFKFYLNNTVDASSAISYLHSRNLTDDIIKRFNIGLAPSGEQDLYNTFASKHLPIDMVSVGLLKEYNGKFYDCFKKRIIFPIENLDGKVVGFSGRRYLDDDHDSKYVNTTETVIFKKGQILYNYREAYSYIRELNKVFLFEGFMDVIAAYRANVYNAVASMGTALTINQIQALKKLTNNIVVCYDGDGPGIDATKRAINLLMQNGVNTLVIAMPEGLDPDEYINKYGQAALHDYLENRQISGIDFLYVKAKEKLVVSDILSVENFKKEIFGYLKTFNSSVITEKFLTKMSEDLIVSVSALNADYQLFAPESLDITFNPPPRNLNTRTKPVQINNEKYIDAENKLLYIAYKHIDKVSEIYAKLEYNSVNDKNFDLLTKINQIRMTDDSINTTEQLNLKLTEDDKVLIEAILNSVVVEPSITSIDILCDTVKEHSDVIRCDMLKAKIDSGINSTEELDEYFKLKAKISRNKRRTLNK